VSRWQTFCSSVPTMVGLLILALFGLAWTAWRLVRNRRNPDSWEGGLLWLMSFLVVVILLART
jgi:hypothetical protein